MTWGFAHADIEDSAAAGPALASLRESLAANLGVRAPDGAPWWVQGMTSNAQAVRVRLDGCLDRERCMRKPRSSPKAPVCFRRQWPGLDSKTPRLPLTSPASRCCDSDRRHSATNTRAHRADSASGRCDVRQLCVCLLLVGASSRNLGCCRFQGHLVKVETETGGGIWERDGDSAGSSSLRP